MSRFEALKLKAISVVEDLILGSRHLLNFFYLGLSFEVIRILIDFMQVLSGTSQDATLVEHTLQTVTLLDITMVANFVWFMGAGNYYVFVDNHYPATSGKKRPRSLAHVSSGLLKEKMAGSLIGISSVNLLQVFLHASLSHEPVNWQNTGIMLAIHVLFIFGLLAFNYANKAEHHNHSAEEAKAKKEKEMEHASADS